MDGINRKIGIKELWKIRWHREWPAIELSAIEWSEWMENLSEAFLKPGNPDCIARPCRPSVQLFLPSPPKK